MTNLNGLYLITDEVLTPKKSILSDVNKALRAGVKIIQLRDKTTPDIDLEPLADSIQRLCQKNNALFVLNDRVNLAIKNSYDGLHVGKSDYANIEKIRKNFQGVLGVSCYDSIETAKKMQSLGIDYVAFGSFFPSKTKPNSAVVPLKILLDAKKQLHIPICAIGGICTNNLEEVTLYEPDMVAVISDVWNSKNLNIKIQEYNNLFRTKECA